MPRTKKTNDKEVIEVNEAATAAAATLAPGSMTKAGMMATVMAAMNGAAKSQVVDIFNAAMAQFGPNTFPGSDVVNNLAPSNQASIATKPSLAREDIEEVFSGEELSEDFKSKVQTIFEAALNSKIEVEIARIEEENEAAFNTLVEEYKDELAEKVDEYLTYAVEEWVKENKLAIESGLKLNVLENFFNGVKKLFVENNISIPEEQSIVDDLEEKNATLESRVNEEIEKNIKLTKVLEELNKDKIFNKLARGLAESQVEKLRTLSEGLSYENLNEYDSKLAIIKETYFSNRVKNVVEKEEVVGIDMLTEENNNHNQQKPTGEMAVYANALAKQLKKA